MKNTPVNRFNVRARCAKLGLPVPEWARKQRRGRPRVKPEKPKYGKRGRPRKPVDRELPDGMLKKRGRPTNLTPEERKFKAHVYNHAYYMRVTKPKRQHTKGNNK